MVEMSDRVLGVECKWSASPDGSCISGLRRFPDALPPERRGTGWVVCTSTEESRIGPVRVIPVWSLAHMKSIAELGASTERP